MDSTHDSQAVHHEGGDTPDPTPAQGGQTEQASGTPEPPKGPSRPWITEGLPKPAKGPDNKPRGPFNVGGGDAPDANGDRPSDRQPGKDGPKPYSWWAVARLMIIGYLLVFAVMTLQERMGAPTPLSYTDFIEQVEHANIKSVFARGDTIQGELKTARDVPDSKGGQVYTKFETERPSFAKDDLLQQLADNNVKVSATPIIVQRGLLMNLLLSFGPILLLVGLWVWMMRRSSRMMGSMMGGGEKKKPIDPETVRVTFKDVAGIDEVQDEVTEIVDYLKNPTKYAKLGARAPKGVLLSGQPGTGKTLLARAAAGEAQVPFFSASGSEFIEMIVGVGAQRVRELFDEARKVAPAIIFIDEIDTIGRRRAGSRSIGGHDEREQTLNQVLTEMDGFTGSEGIVVIAATNRPDVLDPALLRPGRFDRSITVHAPDLDGRKKILAVHTRNVPLGPDTDLAALASATPGMTGAELANLVNEAALLAAKQNAEVITQKDLMDSLEKVQLGAARKVVMPEDERQRTAWHEAGHALLGMLQPGADPVRKVSIIPRGGALGVTFSAPEGDRYGYDRDYLFGRIVGALGGMAAEAIIFEVVTTGAESDLQNATNIARSMVGRWGMSEKIGPVQVLATDSEHAPPLSEDMMRQVDNEVRQLMETAYDRACTLLQEHRDKLEGIVIELLLNETLDEPEIYKAAGIDREEHKAANRGDTTMLGKTDRYFTAERLAELRAERVTDTLAIAAQDEGAVLGEEPAGQEGEATGEPEPAGVSE